jgi:hypothetical protein
MARNISASVSIWELGEGYVISFALLLCAAIFSAAFVLTQKETRARFFSSLKAQKLILIISAFALTENIIMKQHAVAYSYDRIKAIVAIITVILCAVESVIEKRREEKRREEKRRAPFFACRIVLFAAMNVRSYKILNNHFVRKNPNFAIDKVIFNDINQKFTKINSIMVYKGGVRGYINTSANRGVYEGRAIGAAMEIALEKNKHYAVEIFPGSGYDYYDLLNGEYVKARYSNGAMVFETQSAAVTQVLNLTDSNWTNGVQNGGKVLLFASTVASRAALLEKTPSAFILNGEICPIVSAAAKNNGYIHIEMQDRETALKFAHPANFEIQY